MYRGASMLSLADAGRGDIFASSNHSEERELLKGQHEHVFYERNQLQDKIINIEKKMEIQSDPYDISSMVSSIKGSFV